MNNIPPDVEAYHKASMRRAARSANSPGQKFPKGTRVHIAADLGPSMRHFPADKDATVKYTYQQAYGTNDCKSYCLNVDGEGEISWYHEEQLTAI